MASARLALDVNGHEIEKGDKVFQVLPSPFKEHDRPVILYPELEVIRSYPGGIQFAGDSLTHDSKRFRLMKTLHNPVQSGGAKYDDGKLLMSPLFEGLAGPLETLAAILSYGAQKYAVDSWQTVPDAERRYKEAGYRHQLALAKGELLDEESGLPHRAHKIINDLFVMHFELQRGLYLEPTKFNKPPVKK